MGAQANRSAGCQDPCPGQCPSFVPTQELMPRQQASTGWGDTQKPSPSLPPPVFLSWICFPGWHATQAACWHTGNRNERPQFTHSRTALQQPLCPQRAGPRPARGWLTGKAVARILSASPPQRMHFSTQQQQLYTSAHELWAPKIHTAYWIRWMSI